MVTLFILTTIFGILYFLFVKRRFDFFTIAFISACVYFLPGFLGYVRYPFEKGPADLLNEAYWVMITVLTSIILGAVLFDILVKRTEIKFKFAGSQNTYIVVFLITLVAFLLSVATTGQAFFLANKNEMLPLLNRWYILWSLGASLGVVVSYSNKKWKTFMFFLGLLLFEVYIGMRSTFAITLIALFALWISKKGRQVFVLKNFRRGLLGVVFAFFFFIYKFLYISIKLGNWQYIKENLGSSEFYLNVIINSEPFTIQAILNKVIEADYHVGIEHLKGVIYQFVLFAPEMGAEATSFNSMFQNDLFSGLDWGMANNIWAEMWSSGGWPLLILFVVIFVAVLFLGSYLLIVSDLTIRSGVALLFSYWAFYIHRNDLLYQINLEKRVVIIFIICLLGSVIVSIKKPHKLQNIDAHSSD